MQKFGDEYSNISCEINRNIPVVFYRRSKRYKKNVEEKFTHLKEELANVIIYCLSLANQLDIDVATAIDDKIEKNSRKYPI